jgi:hypothetical protein
MRIDVYKSTTNNAKYLSVPAGTDVASFQFPSNLDPDLRQIYPFTTNEEFDPSQPRVGMNIPRILADIQANGFCAHEVVISTTIGNLKR